MADPHTHDHAHSHDHPHVHTTHPAIIKRLNRAAGHLSSIVGMIKAGKPCSEVALQLRAVERAVASAKRTLIEDHVEHCIGGESQAGAEAMAEFRAISKYL